MRRLHLAKMAWPTRTRTLFRDEPAHTLATKGQWHRSSLQVPEDLDAYQKPQYFDMVQTWGSWPEFQALLETLSSVAEKHGEEISLTNVASRWVLQQPAVGAVIVGNRLGVSSHAVENLNIFRFKLDEDDMAAINKVALGEGGHKTRAVFEKLGDCGNEYRAMH